MSASLPPVPSPLERAGVIGPDSPALAQSNAQYTAPWLIRVHDVDDGTLDILLRSYVNMRRVRFALTAVATALGACALGVVHTPDLAYTLLVYATLGFTAGMPAWSIGTLCIRRLFLKEAQRHGLSRSAAMLTLVRAARKARHTGLLSARDDQARQLHRAVRGWDDAEGDAGAIG